MRKEELKNLESEGSNNDDDDNDNGDGGDSVVVTNVTTSSDVDGCRVPTASRYTLTATRTTSGSSSSRSSSSSRGGRHGDDARLSSVIWVSQSTMAVGEGEGGG